MEDSFFGFDTSGPPGNDGSDRIAELSEEDYDALNDETFGEAINGDWEEVHENLVRNLGGVNGNKEQKNESNDEDENSDLGINLSRVKLDDVELCSDDNEIKFHLDMSVWSNPSKVDGKNDSQTAMYGSLMRQNFPASMEAMHGQCQPNRFFGMPPASLSSKMCTVEDIERNIRNQQQMLREQNAKTKAPIIPQTQQPLPGANVPQIGAPTAQQQHHHQQQQQNNFFNRPVVNPLFNSPPRGNFNGPQHQMNMHPGPQLPHRLPPGFSGLPFPVGHNLGAAAAAAAAAKHHPNFPRPLPHSLPIALNNFAVSCEQRSYPQKVLTGPFQMHPNFNAMRPICPPMTPPRLPPHPLVNNAMPATMNQFNQRLMQEIQQNHPMLANTRSHGNVHNPQMSPNQNYQLKGTNNNNKPNPRSNGNLEEYDEYANLMSTRDKHWLIAIQLSQLNTDTPYIDDYYYTVFKERRAKLNGENQSKTHKDNQLNHPLTQPKGHAQLVLISMGKNGTNSRNCPNRERKNSDTRTDKEPNQRGFTPLQFENSLGKLQYGSVTAPRKIIDMDIMGSDSGSQLSSNVEVSTQRKSRQLLLHIETLYKIVLKLEDLENPAAIATSLIVKEKKERERQLTQEHSVDDLNKNEIEKRVSLSNISRGSSTSDGYPCEVESKDKLIQKLLPCLSIDKVIGMMNVRKGRTLIRRILSQIEDNPIRWNVWIGVFQSLSIVLKKDKDDNEGVLYSLYPEFKKHISSADFENLLTIAKAMPLNDKKLNNLLASKFCISSLVAILVRAEEIYSKTPDIASELNDSWAEFLSALSASFNRSAQQHTISAAIETDAVQPMVNHVSRFKNLELEPLLAFFSQAKQQIGQTT